MESGKWKMGNAKSVLGGGHHAANSKIGVSMVFFGFLPVRIIFCRRSTVR